MKSTLVLLLCLSFVGLNAADLAEARRLMESRKVPEARPLIEAYLKEKPEDAEALILLGQCQLQMMQSEPALATLEKAVELAPKNVEAHAALGMALLGEAGRKSSISYARKGKKELEKALEIDPKHVASLENLVGFYDNAPWIVGGDKDKAKDLVKRLKEIAPTRGFLVDVGMQAKAKEFDQAFRQCDERLAATPNDYPALYELGRIAGMASKRQQDGVKALQACLTLPVPAGSPGHAGVNFRLGVLHKQLGNKDQAEACFNEALRLGADDKNLVARVAKARQ